MKIRLWAGLLALLLLLSLTGCEDSYELDAPSPDVMVSLPVDTSAPQTPAPSDPKGNTPSIDENGVYDSKEDVALYLHTYGELPDNYITKNEAEELGWTGGSVENYAPGMCIGGDRFSNREGLLPKANGRTWTECDIGTLGESGRGGKRIVYSNDGLIYYTDDHYESFQQLYGEAER